MSLPVVLRPEASRDAQEARDHLEAQQAGRGQVFLNRLNEAWRESAPCRRCTASPGETYGRRGCGGSLTSFITGSIMIA